MNECKKKKKVIAGGAITFLWIYDKNYNNSKKYKAYYHTFFFSFQMSNY